MGGADAVAAAGASLERRPRLGALLEAEAGELQSPVSRAVDQWVFTEECFAFVIDYQAVVSESSIAYRERAEQLVKACAQGSSAGELRGSVNDEVS